MEQPDIDCPVGDLCEYVYYHSLSTSFFPGIDYRISILSYLSRDDLTMRRLQPLIDISRKDWHDMKTGKLVVIVVILSTLRLSVSDTNASIDRVIHQNIETLAPYSHRLCVLPCNTHGEITLVNNGEQCINAPFKVMAQLLRLQSEKRKRLNDDQLSSISRLCVMCYEYPKKDTTAAFCQRCSLVNDACTNATFIHCGTRVIIHDEFNYDSSHRKLCTILRKIR